jgi:NADH:ubiquinone oxidoreductase subunit
MGKKAGADAEGNVYYRGKPRRGTKRERRWVMYKKGHDASAVPAEWHGWLHHQMDEVPGADNPHRQSWQKPHLKNMTGTDQAYVPPGLKGKRDATTGDYQAWTPE